MSVKRDIYLIIDALHPHCKQSFMMAISGAHFVLEYEETTNREGNKSFRLEFGSNPLYEIKF